LRLSWQWMCQYGLLGCYAVGGNHLQDYTACEPEKPQLIYSHANDTNMFCSILRPNSNPQTMYLRYKTKVKKTDMTLLVLFEKVFC
jgi:hypothetical protein